MLISCVCGARFLAEDNEDFNLDKCTFTVAEQSYSTGRVAGWRDINICNCYTLETSFAGPSKGPHAGHS